MPQAKMIYFEDKWRHVMYACGIAVIVLSLAVSLAFSRSSLSTQYLVPTGNKAWFSDDLIGVGVLLGLTPIAVVSYFNHRYVKAVEKNIPRFLRDILQSTDSGLALPKALLQAASRDYGPISYEIGIAMTKFSLGYSFSSSVNEAGRRLRHSFAPQVALIISEAYSAGGKTHEVLQSSVSLFNGLDEYNQEKQSELKPYTQLVYISVGIFLIISLLIISQFVVPFEHVASMQPQATTSIPDSSLSKLNLSSVPSVTYFQSVFYFSALLESIFAGIVAGKIVDGSSSAGLRHSLLLVAITLIIFNFPEVGIFHVG